MSFRRNVSLVFCLILFLAGTLLSAQDIPELQYQEFVLPNGLQVILHEDHSIPIATVNIWYHVGSKNEKKGRTGFAHLFEHLMFEGSANVPEGKFDQWLEAAGGDNNGSTTEDRTNYYENIPSNAVELALYLESDRMANLLQTIDQKKLDTQRDVVKNERRQGVDNQPYGRVSEVILSALYPSDHPYSWPVIGSMQDLSAASLEDVKDFFRSYYAPNNASLCVAGDIDPKQVRELVEKYFSPIPPGPPVERFETWVPELKSPRVIEMKDNVSLPRLYMVWHTPPIYKSGDAEFDILASILTDGKNSRLYKRLVYDTQIAQDVRSFQGSKEIASDFYIVATAKPGQSLDAIRVIIEEELEKIRKNGVTDQEVLTALNSWESSFLRRLESVGGFRGKANLLNEYNTFTGSPGFLKEDMERYYSLTPARIQKAVDRYLRAGENVMVDVDPAGDLKADDSIPLDRAQKPENGPAPSLTLPKLQEARLSNGLKVMLIEQHELPIVQLNLMINGGWSADPEHTPGVARLTSDLQDEGTRTRSALEISDQLKEIGADLRTSSNFDFSAVSLNTLKKHMDKALALFSDVLTNPVFPEEELQRKKKEYLARILMEQKQPTTVALKSFFRTLYGPDHPYGQPYTGSGTEESIAAIQRDDLVHYYDTYYSPGNATLIAVGDTSLSELTPLLEDALSSWKEETVPALELPPVHPVQETQVYLVDKPGAAQSVIVAGHLGIPHNSKDYFSVEILNTVLGGKFTSRLNMNLREDKAYTYGAFSQFVFRKEVGPFFAFTQVHTEVTKESLFEIMKEFRGLRGENPVTPQELDSTKNYVALRFPSEFETVSELARKLQELAEFNLPNNYYDSYVPNLEKVTVADVTEAAREHIHPDRMLIVVVGDIGKIEPGIRELNLGPVHVIDAQGNPR